MEKDISNDHAKNKPKIILSIFQYLTTNISKQRKSKTP